jgi:hypothetical protein
MDSIVSMVVVLFSTMNLGLLCKDSEHLKHNSLAFMVGFENTLHYLWDNGYPINNAPTYEDFPILNNLVLQTPQVPWVAGRPFFKVTAVGFWISFFSLHLKQYASISPPCRYHFLNSSGIVKYHRIRDHEETRYHYSAYVTK